MKDGYYLLSYTVNGIKNLDKDVRLDFYKKTIDKNFDPREYNVKAIYGENGTGKSAIMTSVKVLKNLILNRRYLNDSTNCRLLDNLINKRTLKLSIEIEFITIIKNIIALNKYKIVICRDEIENYYKIANEELYYRTNTSNNWSRIYIIENGKDIDSCSNKLFKELNKDNGIDTLKEQSFISNFYYKHFKDIVKEDKHFKNLEDSKLVISIMNSILFASRIYVYFDDNDKYDEYIYSNLIKEYLANKDINKKIPDISRASLDDEIIGYSTVVYKEFIEEFENNIKKLYEFIKIFKPELLEIEIDRKEQKDSYVCDLIFNYKDYKVYAAYESNGIKKLIGIYKAIEAVDKGYIVFIDEFDSNIHDVYLCKLIEYVEEYAKGQLCFTTQSITVMDVLENRKKSLDFLSRDHEITSWFKNSHYSASKKYKGGYIEKSPFNIESFDFLKAFGDSIDEL